MKESAKAAYSYVRSHSKELGIKDQLIGKTDIHIHVPEGAVPKEWSSVPVSLSPQPLSRPSLVRLSPKN